MLPHVELNRTFWPLGDTEEHDPDRLRVMSAFGSANMHWPDLLELSRVIILAEAGTGKTHELRQTARRLRAEGKAAFFCNIADLADSGLDGALVEGNAQEFGAWLQSKVPAWLLLDSVDEARLAQYRSFERALRTLARALDSAMGRARIVITARVSDWRATEDLSLVREVLPPGAPPMEANIQSGDATTPDQEVQANFDERISDSDICIVQLSPLKIDQMKRFAAARGVKDVERFVNEIERTESDIFAERPQDLLELIAYWNSHGRIGSHREMLDLNIRMKLIEPDPNRAEQRALANARAFEGAMLLAAALTLTRKNSIVLPDRPVHSGHAGRAVDAKQLLENWDTRDVQTLLGRPLFDESTYGRVQFHHRSVTEYLTARWLCNLIGSNKARRRIEALLFAARYGCDVVVPSMRPMTAWLALWDDRVRERTIEIAPDVLIEHGDPSQLPVDFRARLLRRFASLKEDRGDTATSFDSASVRRLADLNLAPTVLDLLERYRADADVRELLLRMIWQGQMSDGAAAALSFALDSSMDAYTRTYAIRAVQAVGTEEQKRRLAQATLTRESDWDRQELAAVLVAFYPGVLSVDEVLGIVEALEPPPEYSFTAIHQALKQIVSSDSSPEQRQSLLTGLARVLKKEPHIRYYRISQRYAWLLSYAAKLAECIIVDKQHAFVVKL